MLETLGKFAGKPLEETSKKYSEILKKFGKMENF